MLSQVGLIISNIILLSRQDFEHAHWFPSKEFKLYTRGGQTFWWYVRITGLWIMKEMDLLR